MQCLSSKITTLTSIRVRPPKFGSGERVERPASSPDLNPNEHLAVSSWACAVCARVTKTTTTLADLRQMLLEEWNASHSGVRPAWGGGDKLLWLRMVFHSLRRLPFGEWTSCLIANIHYTWKMACVIFHDFYWQIIAIIISAVLSHFGNSQVLPSFLYGPDSYLKLIFCSALRIVSIRIRSSPRMDVFLWNRRLLFWGVSLSSLA